MWASSCPQGTSATAGMVSVNEYGEVHGAAGSPGPQ